MPIEPTGLVAMFILFVPFGAILGLSVRALRARAVVVGGDGLTMKATFSRRFVPYGDIAIFAPHPQGVAITTHAGDVIVLPTWRRGEPSLSATGAGSPASDGATRQGAILRRIGAVMTQRRLALEPAQSPLLPPRI